MVRHADGQADRIVYNCLTCLKTCYLCLYFAFCLGLGLKYKVDIQDVESSPPVFGVENIDAGDSILKVSSIHSL